MIETATLGALTLHDPDGPLRVTGWAGTIAPRVSRSPNPRAHGEVDRTGLVAGRLFSITGNAVGATRAEVQAAVADLAGAVLPPEARTLTWRRDGDAFDLTAQVVLDAPLEVPATYVEPLVVRWGLALYAPDPRAYATTVQDADQTPIPAVSIGELTIANGGNFPAPAVVTIVGPTGSDPGDFLELVNTTTGERIKLDVSLSPTDTAIVDLGERRFYVDAGLGPPVELPQVIDPTVSTWFALQPGANDLELTGMIMDGDTAWSVSWRDAWV